MIDKSPMPATDDAVDHFFVIDNESAMVVVLKDDGRLAAYINNKYDWDTLPDDVRSMLALLQAVTSNIEVQKYIMEKFVEGSKTVN